MRTIGERVRHARKSKGLTQEALAKRIGIKQPTLSGLESGKNNETAFLPEIERETGFRALWLKNGRGPDRVDAEPEAVTGELLPAGTALIPQFDVRGSMGEGIDVPEHLDVVRHIAVSIPDLRRQANFTSPDNLSFITGYGNSMEPTFYDGDVLLVDQGVNEIKYDAVYALEKGKELFIKRIQRRPDGSYVMLSDNKLYEPQPVRRQDMHEFNVRGRVVLAWNAKKV